MTFVFAKENSLKAVRKALENGMTLAYSSGNIAGRADLLQDLFKASVTYRYLSSNDKGKTTYALTNTTSIHYSLKFGKKTFEVPPFETIIINISGDKEGKPKDFSCHVMNMWEVDYKHPKIVFKALTK